MSLIPVIPESAPFTLAQRAWLNGFFAGLLNLEEGAPAGASQLAGLAPAVAVEEEEEMPWHDPALTLAERLALAEGRPVERRLMAAMAQLDCGSCGYDCRSYAEAIARGEETALTLCVPGAGETAKKLQELVQLAPPPPAAVAPAVAASSAPAAGTAGVDRKNPYAANLLEVAALCSEGSEKDVRHVSFDLNGSGLAYSPGDAVGVYPENCPDLVDGILRELKSGGEESVTPRGCEPMPLRQALARKVTLTRPNAGLIRLLSGWSAGTAEKTELEKLADADEDGFLEGADLLDLLEAFPGARGSASDLVASLPPLQPRLYSIASSPRRHPGEVHLTVGVVRYRRRGCARVRRGVASSYLGERVRSGDRVRLFIQPSHGFRLPADGDAPVIMVGPGTGIAPFRAFLQERAVSGAGGRNWLFFGDQRRDSNYLYRRELEEFHREGVLSRLDLAFSRDGDEKVYVQHRMAEASAELWRWLQAGAHFYVCGDAQRMARDVDQQLRRIVMEEGRMDDEQASAYLQTLKQERRYHRDVY